MTTQRNFKGAKYSNEWMTATDIAKAIRKEIAEAKKSGELPKDLKTSVRKHDYSMGRAITIDIRELPEGVEKMHPEYTKWKEENPEGFFSEFMENNPHIKSRYSDAMLALRKKLEEIGNLFNYDNSDTMTDYFDVNYYLTVSS